MLSLTRNLVEPFPPQSTALLVAARAGDVEAYGELCRIYETPLLRQAISLSADLTLAEDLVEETLIEAWRCLARYNGTCQFFTWLCAILLNRHRKALQIRKRFVPFDRPDYDHPAQSAPHEPVDSNPLPDVLARQREQALLVQECIALLPRRHQQVVYLRFFMDCSLQEIAAALDCSLGTVKSRLFHALEKLGRMRLIKEERSNC